MCRLSADEEPHIDQRTLDDEVFPLVDDARIPPMFKKRDDARQ